jgi:hypothetical protein
MESQTLNVHDLRSSLHDYSAGMSTMKAKLHNNGSLRRSDSLRNVGL